MEEVFAQIHGITTELKDDSTIPKNVISKLEVIEKIFSENDDDVHIKIDKALQILEEMVEDTNLQPFIRTRLWNISSLLESI